MWFAINFLNMMLISHTNNLKASEKHLTALGIQWILFNETFEQAMGYAGASQNSQAVFILDSVQAMTRFFKEGVHSRADALNELAQKIFLRLKAAIWAFPLRKFLSETRYM